MAVAAAIAESPTNTDTPRSPKPTLPRTTPWAQVVRGAAESPMESSTESSQPEKIESSPSEPKLTPEKGNVVKKSAWSKPANGVSASSNDSGGSGDGGGSVVVMGGTASWPALSESARLSQKAMAAPGSPRSNPEGSQVPATLNTQQAKQGNANANHNSSNNSTAPARQRPMKRGGGNRQGGSVKAPPPPPPLPVFRSPDIAQSSFANGVQMVGPDFSLTGARPSGGFGSQPSPSNEHSNYRSSNKFGNFGPRGRGDGRNSYHSARREMDQGNHERNSSQNTHTRGANGHPQGRGRSFVGPRVQGATPFAPPPHLVPYGPAIGYPDMPFVYFYPVPLEAAGGIPPFLAPAPPPPYLVDSAVREKVIRQIDYYFSDDNLVKDEFLKSKMNEEGWVSIRLIASFPRVQSLSVSIPNILEFLRASTVVEVQGDSIRRRDDWMKWVPLHRSSVSSGMQSPVDSHDNLASSLQKVSLEEVNQDSMYAHPNSSNVSAQTLKEMTGELPATNMEATIQHVC